MNITGNRVDSQIMFVGKVR